MSATELRNIIDGLILVLVQLNHQVLGVHNEKKATNKICMVSNARRSSSKPWNYNISWESIIHVISEFGQYNWVLVAKPYTQKTK
jgi:hypothetical protein